MQPDYIVTKVFRIVCIKIASKSITFISTKKVVRYVLKFLLKDIKCSNEHASTSSRAYS